VLRRLALVLLLGLVLGPGAPLRAGPLPGVAVSERAARSLGLGPGATLEVAPTPAGPWRRVRVEEVYRPVLYPSEVTDRRVELRWHLPDLQDLLGGADEVDSIVLRLRDPGAAGEVAARLNAASLGFRAYTSGDLARRNSSTFEVIARFHRAISVVAVLASSVFLVVLMALRGEELRRPVGVLRLLGVAPRHVAGAVLLLASGVALAGSLAGVGLGFVLSLSINLYYRRAFDTELVFSRVTPELVGEVLVLSVILGIATGALVAWRLLGRPPLDQVGR